MDKRSLVTTHFEKCEVENVRNEECLKIKIKGLSRNKYTSDNPDYGNPSELDLIIPLWAIPYLMREQRDAIAKWEANKTDFISRIKKAYNTEVQPIKEKQTQ